MGTVKIKTSRRIGIGVARIVEIEVVVVEGFVVPVEAGKSRLKSRPVLMAPKFGFDDGCSSNFDATLVLATMLQSQLHGGHTSEPSPGARVHSGQGNVSDHTKIWSELSGSAAKNGSGTHKEGKPRMKQMLMQTHGRKFKESAQCRNAYIEA